MAFFFFFQKKRGEKKDISPGLMIWVHTAAYSGLRPSAWHLIHSLFYPFRGYLRCSGSVKTLHVFQRFDVTNPVASPVIISYSNESTCCILLVHFLTEFYCQMVWLKTPVWHTVRRSLNTANQIEYLSIEEVLSSFVCNAPSTFPGLVHKSKL